MPRLDRFFKGSPGAILTLAATIATFSGAPAHASNSPLPGVVISGSFGRGKIRIDSIGTTAFTTQADRLAIPAGSDPAGLQSTDADLLLSRSTRDRFVVPAITASAAPSAAVTSEVVRAVRGKRALDFKRLYQDALVATASGFAVGTLASPGLTNHFTARAVLDASFRHLSKISWMGSANSADLLASFLRGGAFGAVEQGIIEVVLGAPQWMSPENRRIVSDSFRRAGLSEGTAQCFEKITFLYGGLWSAFTTEENLNFNLGTTTMVDREFYFLDETNPSVIGVHAHEVGGHCTQWLNLGLVNFLSRYLIAFFSRGEDPHSQSIASIEDGTIECTGNPFECEADAIQTILLREEGSGI